MSARRGERGFSAVELAVAVGLLAAIVVGTMTVLVYGTEAYKQSIGEENALGMATRAVDAIALELKDAPGSSVVFSSATPDQITYQRMIAYDPLGASDAARRVLSQPITIRRVPLAVPGTVGLSAIERTQSGAPTERLGTYVAASDPSAPSLPGLQFSVARSGQVTVIGIVVAVSVPNGKSGSSPARQTTSVSLEVY